MPTKITIIIDNPADPEAFESGYPQLAALARQLPGLRRLESAKVWPKEDGTPTPSHRTMDLFFQQLIGAGTPFTGLISDIEP
jgi:hypothetical protein